MLRMLWPVSWEVGEVHSWAQGQLPFQCILFHLFVLHLVLELLGKRPASEELPPLLSKVVWHAVVPCPAACPEPVLEPPVVLSRTWLEQRLFVELYEVSVAESAEVFDLLV